MNLPTLDKNYGIGTKGQKVRWIQEWLSLQGCGTGIDGGFGPATRAAVVAFQKKKGLSESGIVNTRTFDALVAPMKAALQPIEPGGRTLGQLVVAYAKQHLKRDPREVGGDNRGPWVRLYMNGKDGPEWFWCAGFICFILKQACESMGIQMPIERSVSCDALAESAKAKNFFVAERDVAQGTAVKAGSIFLVRKTPGDWTHTGIVIKSGPDAIHTIEGNTNDDGNRNGYEVCQRIRGYKKKDYIRV